MGSDVNVPGYTRNGVTVRGYTRSGRADGPARMNDDRRVPVGRPSPMPTPAQVMHADHAADRRWAEHRRDAALRGKLLPTKRPDDWDE